MLLTTERAGLVEFNLGVQRLVAGQIANDSLIFRDFKIGTFKCHISLRADKNEFHGLRQFLMRFSPYLVKLPMASIWCRAVPDARLSMTHFALLERVVPALPVFLSASMQVSTFGDIYKFHTLEEAFLHF
jgi:hypothetical protein